MTKKKIGVLLGSLAVLIIILFFVINYQKNQIANQKYQEEQIVLKQKYESGLSLIKLSKWSEVKDEMEYLNYKDSNVLYNYAVEKLSYEAYKKTGHISVYTPSAIKKIPDDYKGDFANDIITYKKYLERKPVYAAPIPSTPYSPKIGMTSEQVLSSTWGKPRDINRTTNKYGVSEQWVYGSSRYIYLDDGIVTAIQD